MPLQLNTDEKLGLIGAIRFGPNSEYRYGGYKQFWAEVESLHWHRDKLEAFEADLADARPSQRERLEQQVADQKRFITALEAAAPEAVAAYEKLEEQIRPLGLAIPNFSTAAGKDGPAYHTAHLAYKALAARKPAKTAAAT